MKRPLWLILAYLYNVCRCASFAKDLWVIEGWEEVSFDWVDHASAALDPFMDLLYFLLFIEKSLDVLGYSVLKWSKLVIQDLLNDINNPSFKLICQLLLIMLLIFKLVQLHLNLLFFFELFLFVRLLFCYHLWGQDFFVILDFNICLKLLKARFHHLYLLLLWLFFYFFNIRLTMLH
jgi:hypothetical protein